MEDEIIETTNDASTSSSASSPTTTPKRAHFEQASVSHESLESVVSTYRAQFSRQQTVNDEYRREHPRRPKNVPWKQQKLSAWQPQFRPATVISTFLGLGVVMLALGVPMLLTMNRAKEYVVDYTDCRWNKNRSVSCADIFANELYLPGPKRCECSVNFEVTENIPLPVFVYYELDGFYQNHRRYSASVDYKQLYGRDVPVSTLEANCAPFAVNNESVPYGPCGAIANSLFNDNFELKNSDKNTKILIENTGIAWPTDKEFRFKNPTNLKKYAKPRDWLVPAQELDPTDESNNGYRNEHLIIWMRTAAFPKFRKIWGRILPRSNSHRFEAGNYTLNIDYNFKTVNGRMRIPKSFVLATSTWLGGRNHFLPILYLVCGALSIVTAVGFILLHRHMQKIDNRSRDRLHTLTGTYGTCSSDESPNRRRSHQTL